MSRLGLFILDVGHGNCAVLVDRRGVLVIDAGPGSTLLEFLTREGIERIEVLLISHADADHIKGTIALLASGKARIGVVRLNTDSMKGSDLWDDLLWELGRANERGELQFDPSLTTNDSGKFSQGSVEVQILAPGPYLAGRGPGAADRRGRRLGTNSISAVIRLMVGNFPVALFPGDIDGIGLANLVESGTDARAWLMVFPHHGGKFDGGDVSAFAGALCDIVQPEKVIFSIGRGRFRNPQGEIVASIRTKLPTVGIACTELSEQCSVRLPGVEPTHLADVFAQGLEEGRCCAGTIVVSLDGSQVSMLPSDGPYQAFIRTHVPAAMCVR